MLALVHLASFYPHYEPDETLEEIAVHHNRHARAVKPYLYDLFLDHLIDTVADSRLRGRPEGQVRAACFYRSLLTELFFFISDGATNRSPFQGSSKDTVMFQIRNQTASF